MSTGFFGWFSRNFRFILAFALVAFIIFYFDGPRNFLSSNVNGPAASAILESFPWLSWMRTPIHWLLMGLEVVIMTWVLARPIPYVLSFFGNALPNFSGWATMDEKERKRQQTLVWVFGGAMSSALFTGTMMLTLLGAYYFRFITPAAIQHIAFWFWTTLCFIEIVMQIIPMIVRQQTQGWDVVADQATSFLPMTGCLLLLGLVGFDLFDMDAEGWLIWWGSMCTAFIELALLALSNKLIATARDEQ